MRPGRWLRRGVTLVGLGVAGTTLVVTTRHLLETPQPLESTLPGEGQIDRKHGGNIYYNVAGPKDAEPMVLLHDFYPGASNYEYRHVFPRFATDYRVYAPDWLGFGLSEHPNIAYTGEFYAAVLTGFLRDVVQRPAIVIGAGHAANVAVRAASDTPDLFTRVILVSPDAMAGLDLEPSVPQVLSRAAQRVSLGVVPYAFLATRPILRRLRDMRAVRLEGNLTTDESLEHLYASAHQFGAHHALLALMTGELDLPIQNALALLTPPALIISGEDDPQHPREEMEDLAVLSPHTDLEILPGAGAAVPEDQPALFVDAVTNWLRGISRSPELGDEVTLESLTLETMILPGTEETTAPEDMGDFGDSTDPTHESTSGVVAEPQDRQANQGNQATTDEPAPPMTPATPRSFLPPHAPTANPIDLADEERNPLAAELTAPEAAAAEAGPAGPSSTTTAPKEVTTQNAVTTPATVTTPAAVRTPEEVTTPETVGTPANEPSANEPSATTPVAPVTPAIPSEGTPAFTTNEAATENPTGTNSGTATDVDTGTDEVVTPKQPRATEIGTTTTPEAALAASMGQGAAPTMPAPGRTSNASASQATQVTPQASPSSVPVRTPPASPESPENAKTPRSAQAAEVEKPAFAERRDASSRKTQPRSRSRSNSRPRTSSGTSGTNASGTSGTKGTGERGGPSGTSGSRHHHHHHHNGRH